MERHAHLLRQVPHPDSEPARNELEQSHVQREFHKRLSVSEITLSAREQEVCLGLLTGGTVPRMAQSMRERRIAPDRFMPLEPPPPPRSRSTIAAVTNR